MDNHGSFHSNRLNRRQLLRSAAAVSGAGTIPTLAQEKRDGSLPASFDGLKPLGSRVKPITSDEYQARIDRVQRLLVQQKPQIDALFVAQERRLLPHRGTLVAFRTAAGASYPTERRAARPLPAFEEARFREQLRIPLKFAYGRKTMSPSKLAASALADRGVRTGRIGVEECYDVYLLRPPASGRTWLGIYLGRSPSPSLVAA